MSALDLLDRYGVPVALIVIVVLGLLPAVRDKIIPAWISLLVSEKEFRRKVEAERLASAQKTDGHIAILADTMTKLAVQFKDQTDLIIRNQAAIQDRENDILEHLDSAVSAMRERVASREGYERGRKEHKTGDTGPLEASK